MTPRNACEHDTIKLTYDADGGELIWQCCDCAETVGYRRAAPNTADGTVDVDMPAGTFDRTRDVWVRRPGGGG